MLRTSLLFLMLACIPALAQNPEIQARIEAQQNLIRLLHGELAPYTSHHPQVSRSRALIDVLEEQSRLLQQPREQWAPDTVKEQVKAITLQLSLLRNEVANYRPSHPGIGRNRALIDLLEEELRSLQSL